MTWPDFQPIEAAAERADGRVVYQEFAPAERAPAPPPVFTFGPLPGYLAQDLYAEWEIGAVGCYRLRGARLTWDAIALLGNTALWSLALNHPEHHVRSVLERNVPGWASLRLRQVAGQAAIIHGPGFDVFGHWLIDFLPRLYVLRRAGLNIEALTFILPSATPSYAREFLRLIGIPDGNLVFYDQKTEAIQAEEILVPTVLRLKNRFHPLIVAATRFWLDRFRQNAGIQEEPLGHRRIFVSRGNHPSHRRLASRQKFEAIAQSAGYEIIHPQTLSLPDQVRLFASAGRIVGEYGSALHSAIFAPEHTFVGALRGTSHHPGFAQSGLAERFGHRLGYVFGPTPEHAADAAFDIAESAFANALSAIDLWDKKKKEVLF